MYNAYANTKLETTSKSFKLLEHSISLENLSKLFMIAIKSESYEIFHIEPLKLLTETNDFKPIRNVLLTYSFNVQLAYNQYVAALELETEDARALRHPLQPLTKAQKDAYSSIVIRLNTFAMTMIGTEEARKAIIDYRIEDLKALLNTAAEFIISIDPNNKGRIFQQDPIYRQEQSLFKDQ